MVVAVTVMRVMQVITHEVIHVIPMRNRFVPTVRPMDVACFVSPAVVFGRATDRIEPAHFNFVFFRTASAHVQQMAVLEIVDMTIMFHSLMAASRAMDMRDGFVLDAGFIHYGSPFVSVHGCLAFSRLRQ